MPDDDNLLAQSRRIRRARAHPSANHPGRHCQNSRWPTPCIAP